MVLKVTFCQKDSTDCQSGPGPLITCQYLPLCRSYLHLRLPPPLPRSESKSFHKSTKFPLLLASLERQLHSQEEKQSIGVWRHTDPAEPAHRGRWHRCGTETEVKEGHAEYKVFRYHGSCHLSVASRCDK